MHAKRTWNIRRLYEDAPIEKNVLRLQATAWQHWKLVFKEEPEDAEDIFLDFPSESFDVVHAALMLALTDLRVIQSALEKRLGPVLAEVLEY